MTAAAKKRRNVEFAERYIPSDGSTLTDPILDYLIAGYTDKGNIARPGERFYNAMWSRDSSGTCGHGDHAKCAHNPGAKQGAGVPMEGADGLVHTWRCGCACHGYTHEPPPVPRVGQLELFEVA